jgi:hypothetical protein
MSNLYTLSTIEMEIEKQHRELCKAQSLPDAYPTFKEITLDYTQKVIDSLQALKQSMIACGIGHPGAGYIVPEGPHASLSREVMGISNRMWNTAPVVKHAKKRWRVFLE